MENLATGNKDSYYAWLSFRYDMIERGLKDHGLLFLIVILVFRRL